MRMIISIVKVMKEIIDENLQGKMKQLLNDTNVSETLKSGNLKNFIPLICRYAFDRRKGCLTEIIDFLFKTKNSFISMRTLKISNTDEINKEVITIIMNHSIKNKKINILDNFLTVFKNEHSSLEEFGFSSKETLKIISRAETNLESFEREQITLNTSTDLS